MVKVSMKEQYLDICVQIGECRDEIWKMEKKLSVLRKNKDNAEAKKQIKKYENNIAYLDNEITTLEEVLILLEDYSVDEG